MAERQREREKGRDKEENDRRTLKYDGRIIKIQHRTKTVENQRVRK